VYLIDSNNSNLSANLLGCQKSRLAYLSAHTHVKPTKLNTHTLVMFKIIVYLSPMVSDLKCASLTPPLLFCTMCTPYSMHCAACLTHSHCAACLVISTIHQPSHWPHPGHGTHGAPFPSELNEVQRHPPFSGSLCNSLHLLGKGPHFSSSLYTQAHLTLVPSPQDLSTHIYFLISYLPPLFTSFGVPHWFK